MVVALGGRQALFGVDMQKLSHEVNGPNGSILQLWHIEVHVAKLYNLLKQVHIILAFKRYSAHQHDKSKHAY